MTSQGWLWFQQCHLYLVLLPRFSTFIVTNRTGVLLPHLFTLAMLWRYIFCGTIPGCLPGITWHCILRSRLSSLKSIKVISHVSGKFTLIFLDNFSRFIIYDFKRLLLISRHSWSDFPLTNFCLNLL